MIKVTISYPRIANCAFDHDYFITHHLPLLVDRVGSAATHMTVDRGLSVAPWPDADSEVICAFTCESQEVFEAAFFPHMEELQDDMDRCGGGSPVIQLSKVVLDRALKDGVVAENDLAILRSLRRQPALRAVAG